MSTRHDSHHRGTSRAAVASPRPRGQTPARPATGCARRCSRPSSRGAARSHGLRFLDLYAGSGAVGLEAWSRGAGVVTLVEQDRRTAALISAQRPRRSASPRPTWSPARSPATLRQAAGRAVRRGVPRPALPPADDDVAADLSRSSTHDWLVPGALVVVERAARGAASPPGRTASRASREKKYGETVLWYGHAAATSTA